MKERRKERKDRGKKEKERKWVVSSITQDCKTGIKYKIITTAVKLVA
jgi:hypothetical protein